METAVLSSPEQMQGATLQSSIYPQPVKLGIRNQREGGTGSVRKKADKSAHYRHLLTFRCTSSLYFSPVAHIVALITYNLQSRRSSAICVRIFGAFLVFSV